MPTQILGNVSDGIKEHLRSSMIRSCSKFETYRGRFNRAGISIHDIQNGNPWDLLKRLPVMDSKILDTLSNESLRSASQIIDIETSSGTTGIRKRRFITPNDERTETSFLARLFRVSGVGTHDSVACVDTGPLTLMMSFTKALGEVGVKESYAYVASPDSSATTRELSILDPTVIITIPSILERCIPSLTRYFEKGTGHSLKKIIYVGEQFPNDKRTELETALGVKVYSYYGASETSSLGIECSYRKGIHIFTDQNIIELRSTTLGNPEGDILVTTLGREGLPLFRYSLNDTIVVKNGPCPCGLMFPRVDVIGRSDHSTTILGVNISFDAILKCAYPDPNSRGPIEIVLTRDHTETLDVILPSWKSSERDRIKNAILGSEPDLNYLEGARFLELKLTFKDSDEMSPARKAEKIQDRREAIAVDSTG